MKNTYLDSLREAARHRRVLSDSIELDAKTQSFRAPPAPGTVESELEFTRRCLEHERTQLRKTTELLRRAERERDEALAALERA